MNELIDMVLGYLRGIWRNRWYALVCAWLICVVGWVGVFMLPDQYEASARVYVDTQTILRPVLQGLTVDLNPNAQVDLITRTLFSRPNLEKVAQMTGLDIQAKDPESMERLLRKLQQKINFTTLGRSGDLFSISYEDRDAQLAKNMVQAVVTVFEKNLVGSTREGTDAAQQFLTEQIHEYELRLINAENRLKDFKIRNAGRMPSEGQTYYVRMQQAAVDLEAARLELAQSENRRNVLRQQLREALEQQLQGEGEVAIVLPIDGRIQTLEQKLDELLIQYTDKHPDVNILRQTIIDLKQQREKERTQLAASLVESNINSGGRSPRTYSFLDEMRVKLAEEEANIASLQVRLNNFKRRYEELQDQVNILPQIEAELIALDRDYEVNRKKHDELVSRRESLRLSEQAEQSKQEVQFRVIDPPRVPPNPTGPKRFLLMTMVLGAGLGAGVGLAFLIAQLWPTFDSRASLTRITDIPVFGSVSAVLSPVALRRERRWIAAYVSLSGMLVVTYAGLVVVERIGIL